MRKRAQQELDYINDNTRGLNKHQQAAAASTRYNVGSGNFEKSKAFAALKAGDHATFEREAYDPKIGFVRANGKVVPGLQNRRQKELELFRQKQDYATPTPKLTADQNKNVPKYGTVEWYKKYGTDPNQAVDA